MTEEPDSYRRWASSYSKTQNWEATYQRGQWDYLNGIGEVPHYAITVGYIHKLLRGGDVLDAGCGEAILTDFLDLGRFRYTGFDVSATAIARAEARERSGTVVVSSIEAFAPPAGTRYDAVVFSESLQHIDAPLESIDRYREFLSPQGFIVISLYQTPHEHGNGPRLSRFITAECERGRYALIDRSRALSVSHGLAWEIFVLR